MDTQVIKIDRKNIDKKSIEESGRILREGGLVAFPTETVYGLGGNAFDAEASSKIYGAKGRPSDNPLIVHIADISELADIASYIPENATKLMKKFWPGPLTIVFKKTEKVPYATTGGLETVAVRMPNDEIALSMIKAAKVPVAAPSANTSGRPSPTKASHVAEDLDGKIDMILDGGEVGIGIESTIIDVTSEIPMILRPGYITKGMMEKIVGEVIDDKVVNARSIDEISKDDYAPKAPGMKYRHYAPKAMLTMYDGDIEAVVKRISAEIEYAKNEGKKVGVIATDETKERYTADYVVSIGTRSNIETVARHLYDVLRGFDDTQADVIFSETFYENEFGLSVMNRLIKAGGYRLIRVEKDEV